PPRRRSRRRHHRVAPPPPRRHGGRRHPLTPTEPLLSSHDANRGVSCSEPTSSLWRDTATYRPQQGTPPLRRGVLPASAERVARTPVASSDRRRNFDYRLLGAGDEGALAAAGGGLATQALRLPRCLLAAELGEQGCPLVPA